MKKPAILFIDANNWYHNIKHWFRPSDLDIRKVADMIAQENNLDFISIRWYTSMPNRQDNELAYKKQRSFLGYLKKQGISIISRKLQKLSNKELKKKRQDFIESWDLCKICKPLVEESFLDIADHHQKEKGIDVWIAVDIINESMKKFMEYCVLLSGDADFVPALDLAKKLNVDILSCSVPRGYSNELRQKFPYLILTRDKLIKCLKDYKKDENE